MGTCASQKSSGKLQRSVAQKHIEIDFEKLMKYNKEKEAKEGKEHLQQQQSFCQIFLQENKQNAPYSLTQNLGPSTQLEYKRQ
ncbi:unnamed protein product [Paramecium primaurelia]|uniref:Uncharacterized protein n=1 Tax=Paramecium primaurelia TaxID=5886 RepID=A0A8S1NHQ3_PARPR|nr:unnamed protein product [Paramecium primaurelia]